MNLTKRLYIINDKSIFNVRYRKNILSLATSQSLRPVSVGLLDGFAMGVRAITLMMFGSNRIITSNLKTNLVFLLFFYRRGVIIVNGLGRLSHLLAFRRLVGLLIRCNWRKQFLIQNYRDFRYYRRFFSAGVLWMPGSGGRRKQFGDQGVAFAISRAEKIEVQLESLRSALQKLPIQKTFQIIGLDSLPRSAEDLDVRCRGYVPQSEIFYFGDSLVHLGGYGEGFPHVLVEALLSGITIFIERKYFREFGLRQLGLTPRLVQGNWVSCVYGESWQLQVLSEDSVADLVLGHIEFLKES